jgi:hypothetical protein
MPSPEGGVSWTKKESKPAGTSHSSCKRDVVGGEEEEEEEEEEAPKPSPWSSRPGASRDEGVEREGVGGAASVERPTCIVWVE